MIINFEPKCIEYAKANGPAKDDGMAWCLGLARFLKLNGFSLEKAAMHLSRLAVSGEGDALDDEEILMHCRAAWANESELTCKELILCKSFVSGCIENDCPEYEPPVIPIASGPTLRRLAMSDPPGTIGVDEDGKVKIRKSIATKDGGLMEVMEWISDCPAYIHTETIAEKHREFIFEGLGANDKSKVRFCMPAEDLADSKKFKASLINAFGAANRVGTLTFEIVQQITKNTIHRRRLLMPIWVDGKPMVPGTNFSDDIEYRLLEMIPANVYAGDLEKSKEVLSRLLDIPGPMTILVTAILGSPIYARWFLNDRFGVGMWGTTGSLKTSITKKAMSVYGVGYNDDSNLLKHGKSGSTAVGELEILASAGILPEIVDNVKSVDPRDAQQYISMVHAVIEGKEKVRGKKDGGVRDSKPFLCTPIITGEIKPDEASTSARVLNLKWEEPKDKRNVDYVQSHISDLPVIGYHWLRFLAEIDDPRDGFDEFRSIKTDEFNKENYTNSGRLATIYALLRTTWNLICRSPFGEVFQARTEKFLADLDNVCAGQGRMVSDETEVAKFMRGIAAILAAQPHLIQKNAVQMPDEYGKTYRQEVIGRWMEDGDLFLIPDQTLKVLKSLGVFSQIPTIGSITDALAQAKFITEKDGRKRVQQRVNDSRPRGWLIPRDKLPIDNDSFGDDENDTLRHIVTKSPPSPPKKQNIYEGKLENSEKKNDENTGDNGDNDIDIVSNKVVDSDSDINILSPNLSQNLSQPFPESETTEQAMIKAMDVETQGELRISTKQSTCNHIMERIRKSGKPVTNFAVRTEMRDAGYDLTGKEIEELMRGT
jgi:hypothetical protein